MTAIRDRLRGLWASSALRVVTSALIGALVGALVASVVVAVASPVYTARAEVRVMLDAPAGYDPDALRSAKLQAVLLSDAAVSPPALEAIGQTIDPPATAVQLAGTITSRVEADLLLIGISARAGSPERAAALANAAAARLEARHPRDASQGIVLGEASVATPPSRQSFPHPVRDIAIGAIAGATLAAAFVTLELERRRRDREADAPRPRPAEPLAIACGLGVGVVLLSGMAVGLPTFLLAGLGVIGMIVAVASPGAGLALIAFTIPLREPPGFVPLGFQPLLITATAFGMFLPALARGALRRPSALVIVGGGFLAISAASALTGARGFDAERTVQALARLIQVAPGMLLVGIAWIYFTRHHPLPHLVIAVCGAAIAGVLAIMQYAASDIASLPLGNLIVTDPAAVTVDRATGPFNNPNYFGFFCTLALMLAVPTIGAMRRGRLVVVAMTIPIAVGIVLSFSRGALLAAAAALVALVWVRSPRTGAMVAITLLAIAVVAYPVLLEVRSGAPVGVTSDDIAGEVSDSWRLAAVLSGIPVWLNEPMFGVGFGQFGFESAWFVGSSPATSSHNEYLSILAEQGIVGAALWGLLAAGLAVQVVRMQKGTHGLAIGMFVALLLGWMIIEPLASLQTSGLAWLALGAGAAGPLTPVPHSLPVPVVPRKARATRKGATTQMPA